MNKHENPFTRVDRSTLIHGIYRSLLNSGRTYAAFETEQLGPLIERLQNRGEIFDPMSGYGTLTKFCAFSKHPLKSYCMEANEPAYLWQILMHPRYANAWIKLSDRILSLKPNWPRIRKRAVVCADWYPLESQRILFKIWDMCVREIEKCSFKRAPDPSELALAFLLPFCARFASMVEGNVSTNVKKGGICVYHGWRDDFEKYLYLLRYNLVCQIRFTKRMNHTAIFGDCTRTNLPAKRFTAMITSPPYPNSRNYSNMFLPEQEFIKLVRGRGMLESQAQNIRLIGSPVVSPSANYPKRTINEVNSPTAVKFLSRLKNYRGSIREQYDIEVYYLPYFCNYFVALEKAYFHVSSSLSDSFEGYIVVVNNTARKTVVPVAEAIIEIWRNLGFFARIESDLSRELSHVGGLNPNVKGLSARHMEYTIKVWR